jgi:Bacillus haemolytic enterotoxin (HBL)
MINAQLSPPAGFQNSISATGNSIASINNACESIIRIQPISSSSVPSLSQDLVNTQNVAQSWLSGIQRDVLSSLAGIVGFNQMFQSVFNSLLSISQQIATGNTAEIPQFKAFLSMLQTETQNQQSQVDKVQQEITQYLVQVDNSLQVLNNDGNQLQNAANALNQQMQVMEQQMNALQQKINDEESNPFSKLWYELTGQLQDLEKQQNALGQNLNNVNGELQETYADLNEVRSFQGLFSQIQGGLNGLANGWESLNADLKEVVGDENISDFNAFTPALVQAAQSDWTVAANLAQSFL